MSRASFHFFFACTLSVPLGATLSACGKDSPKVPFVVSSRLDNGTCAEQALSSLNPKTLRLSMRVRDPQGNVAKDGAGAPLVCDAQLDPAGGKIFALPSLPAGGKADLFVEAFDDQSQRLATGALLGVDPTMETMPTLRLRPTERFTCTPATTSGGAGLRLAQHRAFHTATTLPGGKVLFLGGLTTAQSGDAPVSGAPEVNEGYYVTGSAELFDPATNTIVTVQDSAPVARAFHQAAVLGTDPDGKVRILVSGGVGPSDPSMPTLNGAGTDGAKAPAYFRFRMNPNTAAAPAEVLTFDPAGPSLSHTTPVSVSRPFEAGASLPGGRMVLAGGLNGTVATKDLSVITDPTAPLTGSLAAPRGGAAIVPISDGETGLLVGGVSETLIPAPFERLTLSPTLGATQLSAAITPMPTYLFPTVTLLDPLSAAPRVLVSGGLQVSSGLALDPPDTAMQLVRYSPTATSLEVTAPGTAFAGWTMQKASVECTPDTYRAVVWNAATLLISDDGVLTGDRVLLTGGSPNSKCNECQDPADPSHTCAIAQAATVTIPANVPLTLAQADSLQVARFGHTQTLLPDHTVLVAGGLTHQGQTLGAFEVEVWNPARKVPVTTGVDTGDADDPLKAELRAAGLTRAPAQLAAGGVIACKEAVK